MDPASVAEEKQQIHSAPLHALKKLLLRAGALDHVGLQPEPRCQLVFEDEVGLILIADALLYFHEQALSHLLPDRQQRGALSRSSGPATGYSIQNRRLSLPPHSSAAHRQQLLFPPARDGCAGDQAVVHLL